MKSANNSNKNKQFFKVLSYVTSHHKIPTFLLTSTRYISNLNLLSFFLQFHYLLFYSVFDYLSKYYLWDYFPLYILIWLYLPLYFLFYSTFLYIFLSTLTYIFLIWLHLHFDISNLTLHSTTFLIWLYPLGIFFMYIHSIKL